LASSQSHIEQIEADMPAIIYDGGRILDPATREELFGVSMPSSDARELLEDMWQLPVEIQVAGDERILCRREDRQTQEFCRLSGLPFDYLEEPRAQGKIFRVACWGDVKFITSLTEDFRERYADRFSVTRGADKFLDVLPFGVSKGSALDAFILNLGTRPEFIVAAGDHLNDLEMLQLADLAAIPEDAFDAIRPAADVIFPSVARQGFAALAKFLIEEKNPERLISKRDRPVIL
jgi:HAD superfamily hydrolase (TIGR01484 family)